MTNLDNLKYVNQPIMKSDAMSLVTGKPVYLDDVAPKDCLIVKVLRSPHANAIIENINTTIASKVPGIEAIFTYQDVSQKRFTMAGQTYPEPSKLIKWGCSVPLSNALPVQKNRNAYAQTVRFARTYALVYPLVPAKRR